MIPSLDKKEVAAEVREISYPKSIPAWAVDYVFSPTNIHRKIAVVHGWNQREAEWELKLLKMPIMGHKAIRRRKPDGMMSSPTGKIIERPAQLVLDRGRRASKNTLQRGSTVCTKYSMKSAMRLRRIDE